MAAKKGMAMQMPDGSLWVSQLANGDVGLAAPAGILVLGLLTGLRHSMEADHVAAVSTMVVSSGRSAAQASVLGAMWGAGHTASLLAAGLLVMLFAANIPDSVSGALEFAVAVMLVLLGAASLTGLDIRRLAGTGIARIAGSRMRPFQHPPHAHPHTHRCELAAGKKVVIRHDHAHAHVADHRHSHKSLLVGMMHGLAGSGAVTLVVLSSASSVPAGLAYIALFGIGSISGMIAVSAAVGLSFKKLAGLPKLRGAVKCGAALATVAIGAGMIYGAIFAAPGLSP